MKLRHRRYKYYALGCGLLALAPWVCLGELLVAYLVFPPAPADMVLMGLDARPGQGNLTRTDSVMLLNITPGDLRVSLLSIPRDVYIQVPDLGEQRINTINMLGEYTLEGTTGPDLLKASLKESFDVNIEKYVRLDFSGFVELVDAVDGVDIDVPKLIVDNEYPTMDGGFMTVRFEPGPQHMDGERALQYVRTRHADDDYRRAERQQQVVDAILSKLSDPRHVPDWLAVAHVVQSRADTDLSTWDMVRLAPALLIGWPNRTHRVLEREDLIGMAAGYWRPDYERLLPWIEAHFD